MHTNLKILAMGQVVTIYTSTLVMLCMYGASTVLRMRFVPVAILILIIVIVEETLLNYGDIAVEPWDIVAQLYRLALVIWGCLVEGMLQKYRIEKHMY